jgi:hypothetical protein
MPGSCQYAKSIPELLYKLVVTRTVVGLRLKPQFIIITRSPN